MLSSTVIWEIEAGFLVILFCGPHLLIHRLYYEPHASFFSMQPNMLDHSIRVTAILEYLKPIEAHNQCWDG